MIIIGALALIIDPFSDHKFTYDQYYFVSGAMIAALIGLIFIKWIIRR